MKTKLLRSLLLMIVFAGLWPVARAATLTITPSAVSNFYTGNISVLITNGLTNAETVVVEKYLDLNTNGIIDASDLLVGGVLVRDGQQRLIGGATNLNRFRDVDNLTNASVTTELTLLNINPEHLIGRYLFRASSTNSHYTPVTNTFTITNFPFAQKFTGVVTNGASNVNFAGVALLRQGVSGGNTPFYAGIIASNSGAFTINAATGTYSLIAFKNGYVADFSAAPTLTLGASQTLNTNLALIAATATNVISGRLVELGNTNLGLSGVQLFFQSTNDLFTLAWTDTNGNFRVPLTPGVWKMEIDELNLARLGYVSLQDQGRPVVTNFSGNVSNILISLPKVVSMFYGTVKDNFNQPVPDIDFYGSDGNSYSSTGLTDTNGSYSVGVTTTNWNLGLSSDTLAEKGYVGSGGTNFTFGSNQAVQVQFRVIAAAGLISGSVRETNGNPVTDINVYASANIGGVDYQASANTDENGNYSLRVTTGTNWLIRLDCYNLSSRGLDGSTNRTVSVTGTNHVADFAVPPIPALQVVTTNLASGLAGNFYSTNLVAAGGAQCGQSYNWTQTGGSLPNGITLFQDGQLSGVATNVGTFNFAVQVTDSSGSNAIANLSLTIQPSGPLIITSSSLPDAAVGCAYSNSLSAMGGGAPYTWGFAFGSAPLPAGLMLASNGVVFGNPGTNGSFAFIAQVTDTIGGTSTATISMFVNSPVQIGVTSLSEGTVGSVYFAGLSANGGTQPRTWSVISGSLPSPLTLNTNAGQITGTPTIAGTYNFTVRVADACSFSDGAFAITIYNPIQVTTASLPRAFVNVPYNAQLAVTGGNGTNSWMLANGSASLPTGLNLPSSGVITGTPAGAGTNNFIVQVNDSFGRTATRGLSLTNLNQPRLDMATPLGSNQFRFRVLGATGLSYTFQYNTNLGTTNWTDFLSTNNVASNVFNVIDASASNAQRNYRLRVN